MWIEESGMPTPVSRVDEIFSIIGNSDMRFCAAPFLPNTMGLSAKNAACILLFFSVFAAAASCAAGTATDEYRWHVVPGIYFLREIDRD